jgi:hypothetical protein
MIAKPHRFIAVVADGPAYWKSEYGRRTAAWVGKFYFDAIDYAAASLIATLTTTIATATSE